MVSSVRLERTQRVPKTRVLPLDDKEIEIGATHQNRTDIIRASTEGSTTELK